MDRILDKFDAEKVAFTVCNYAYLHKALVLKSSFESENAVPLLIILFEEPEIIDVPLHKDVLIAAEFDFEDFYDLAFKYDVTEFTTSLKPRIALYLGKFFRKIIFLDPDIYVLGSFSEIFKALDDSPLILTPHWLKSRPVTEGGDLPLMRYGAYNLGFFAVSIELGSNFLKWWDIQLKDHCYFETQIGLSTDQKWLNVGTALFPDYLNWRDAGFNLAYWNLFERKIALSPEADYTANDDKIVFVHFSNFVEDLNSPLLTKRDSIEISEDSLLFSIMQAYREKLSSVRQDLRQDMRRYSYDFHWPTGLYLTQTIRRWYGHYVTREYNVNPFKSQDVGRIGKKYKWLTKRPMTKSMNQTSLGFKKQIIISFLKLSLYFVGHNNSNNIDRLFHYMSSPQRINNFYNNQKLRK